MKSTLTVEEIEVLNEFVHNVKSIFKEKFPVVTTDDIRKQMVYNFRHGKGAALKLLCRVLPFIHTMYELTEDELKILEKKADKVAKYEVWHWEYAEELPELDSSYIVIKGEGYVILKTGIRIDFGPDYYQHIREEFYRTGIYDEGMR